LITKKLPKKWGLQTGSAASSPSSTASAAFSRNFSAGPVVWGFDPAAQDSSLSKAKAYFAKDTIIEHLLFSTFFWILI
jgi:hypothetical protein